MKRLLTRPSGMSMLLILAALALTLAIWGCSGDNNSPMSSNQSNNGELTPLNPQIQAVMVVQNRHTYSAYGGSGCHRHCHVTG